MLVNVVTMLVNVDTILVNVVTLFFVRNLQNNDRTLSIKICIVKMYTFVYQQCTHLSHIKLRFRIFLNFRASSM